MKRRIFRIFRFASLFLLLSSCGYKESGYKESTSFFEGGGLETALYALSKEASLGSIALSRPEKLEYLFDKPLPVPPDSSLEVEYRLGAEGGGGAPGQAGHLVLSLSNNGENSGEGEASWALPLDAAFLGIQAPSQICYAVPVSGAHLTGLSIALQGEGRAVSRLPLVFELTALRLVQRWYGFQNGGALRLSPFISRQAGDLVIDPPERYRPAGDVSFSIGGLYEGAVVQAGERRFEYAASVSLPDSGIVIPSGALSGGAYPLTLTAPEPPAEFRVFPAAAPAPREPVRSDPGIILDYPQSSWRSSRYEVFRWEAFPSILIFDTADYAVQDRLFKRLAFFVEKSGFRGRLAGDDEIAGLHGWNAHDYSAASLASFFETAAKTHFPLSPEERELEEWLLANAVIRREGSGFAAGEGAVLSISRESPAYLRSTFMVHEGFHGIFFIDPDFRSFSYQRWEQLSPEARRFILAFFDYQHYDIKDTDLVVNEFMAHCLQQPVSRAGAYFGETLAGRVYEIPWRRPSLPPPTEGAALSWPQISRAFTAEAEAFSNYVRQRWGLSAGRVRRISVE